MGYGDAAGTQVWRAATFLTPASGEVALKKGDAVVLSGGFEAANGASDEDALLGQALGAVLGNGQMVSVGLRGILRFRFVGVSPDVDGAAGVVASATAGRVKKPAAGNGHGVNLKVMATKQTITLSSVVAGEDVTVNGLTFTAHADTTTPANREFAVNGDDAADAEALAGLINDAAYGVPGVTASADGAVVTVEADDADNTAVAVSEDETTMTVAVAGGNVWVLL